MYRHLPQRTHISISYENSLPMPIEKKGALRIRHRPLKKSLEVLAKQTEASTKMC